MEKTRNLAVVPCDMEWNDIGSWNAMAELIALLTRAGTGYAAMFTWWTQPAAT